MKNHFRLLYVTTKDVLEARTIAQHLLENRLIACANILPQMEAIFRWDDKVQKTTEVVLILKTHELLVRQATQEVEKLHSYKTPCVLQIPIEDGSEGYLHWMLHEVQLGE